MNSKLSILYVTFTGLVMVIVLQITILTSTNKNNESMVHKIVQVVGLPDLAIVTENYFLRHRSLYSSSEVFNEGPEHIELFPSTFVYSAQKAIQ